MKKIIENILIFLLVFSVFFTAVFIKLGVLKDTLSFSYLIVGLVVMYAIFLFKEFNNKI